MLAKMRLANIFKEILAISKLQSCGYSLRPGACTKLLPAKEFQGTIFTDVYISKRRFEGQ